MLTTYTLALLVVLLAVWVFKRTDEDVYMVLAASIAIICFIIGFAHAHWIAQGTIALSLFLVDRYLRPRTSP